MKSAKIKLVLFCLLAFGGVVLCYKPKTSGFALSKFRSTFQPRPEWEISYAPQDLECLNDIFSQKFVYLDRGTLSYAFVSEDQKYVVKFLNMEHLTPKTWLKFIPFSDLNKYRTRKVDQRAQRLKKIFAMHKLCYERFKEETGLLFVHLNKTKNLNKKITLIDRKGKEWPIDLDTTVFLVQEKAELIYSRLGKLIKEGDLAGAKMAKEAMLKFIASRCQKGLVDHDKGVGKNYGFVGDRVIQIDISELAESRDHPDLEVERVRQKMDTWIQNHYPLLKAKSVLTD
jgi:hypothetical protein